MVLGNPYERVARPPKGWWPPGWERLFSKLRIPRVDVIRERVSTLLAVRNSLLSPWKRLIHIPGGTPPYLRTPICSVWATELDITAVLDGETAHNAPFKWEAWGWSVPGARSDPISVSMCRCSRPHSKPFGSHQEPLGSKRLVPWGWGGCSPSLG